MSQERLKILCVSPMPASPPRIGAQARLHGLMTQLARRHDLTAAVLFDDDEFDAEVCHQAMQAYCGEVVMVPFGFGGKGLPKRLLQLRSLTSTRSFHRLLFTLPRWQQSLDRLLRARRFDIVDLQFPFFGHCDLRQAPPGEKPPAIVIDSHNIEYDLARQYARNGNLVRRLYGEANWRKLRQEELRTYRNGDGVYLCSAEDERRLLNEIPKARTTVIPNAADVDYFKPRPTDPRPDGRTIVFFGVLSYVPNADGVLHFVKDIWPRVAAAHPDARCKIIGGRPPPSLLALAGPRVELTGFVPDLRQHLAPAAAVVVPLRLGGGTRLKVVEAMAMGKAIVSTRLGVEGIEAIPGRDILVEDDPAAFADAVSRLLADPSLAARVGQSARQLAVERYAWSEVTRALEGFYRRVLREAGS